MIFVYYGPETFIRYKEIKKKILEIQKSKEVNEIIEISFENEHSIEKFKESVSFQGLFSSNQIKIIKIKNIKSIEKNDKKIFKELLKKCEKDNLIQCIIDENWQKKIFPVIVRPLFKEVEYKEYFCEKLVKSKAIEYIKNSMEEIGIDFSGDLIEKIYEMEGGDMFSVYNESIKLSFLNKSDEELDKILSSEYAPNITMSNLSRAILDKNNIGYKLYYWENFIMQTSFYNGVMPYLSKVSNDINIMNSLVSADIKTKSGLLDPDDAVLEFILNN